LGVEGDSFPPQAAAAYCHLYGIRRDNVDSMLETFPIVKRKDEQAHGEYRTERVILGIYDAMQQAKETGTPYHTRLNSPPVHGWTPPEITLEVATGRQIIAEQRKDVMNLSPKAIRFIIEALEHYQTFHEERLRNEHLTEDEVADLTNDCQYLEAIKTDLKKYHGELLHQRSSHAHES
jgi:hypothetical protein